MKLNLKKQLFAVSTVCVTLGAVATSHANDPATDARLRALEHELSILRTELSAERAAKTQRPTDFVAGEYTPPPMVDPIDSDDVFVTPKQSAITELKVRGRMHFQGGYSQSDDHSDFHTLEWRRLRLGVSGKLLDDWSFEIVGNMQTSSGSTLLEDAYLRYNGLDWATISLVHLRPTFGGELGTSSSKIKTVERSLLSNTMDPGKITGLNFAGDYGIFNWQLGAYNGEKTDQRSSERTDLGNEGVPEYLLNASVGLDFSEHVGFDKLAFGLDFISNKDNDGLGGQNFAPEEAWAAHVSFANGPFSLLAEYVQADYDGGGEISGFYVIPSVMITDKLEGVLRYENVQSDGGATLRHQSRYARRVIASDPGTRSGGTRGEDYWALYGGVNYYVNKSLKLMFGVEYAELDDIVGGGDSLDTLSGFAAVRLEF